MDKTFYELTIDEVLQAAGMLFPIGYQPHECRYFVVFGQVIDIYPPTYVKALNTARGGRND